MTASADDHKPGSQSPTARPSADLPKVEAGTPCLNRTAASPKSEHDVRYTRLLTKTRAMRARGETTTTINIRDLEAVLAIAASSAAALQAVRS